jgi:hypothetical protein
VDHPTPEHSADYVRVCLCRLFPAEPFPRLVWHEDCPHHGKAVNPYWPELSDGDDDDGMCSDETPCGNCSRPDPPALIDGQVGE